MTIATLINELSFDYDRFDYETKDFLPHDEMSFARKVLMEKMLDGLFFLRYGGKNGIDSEVNANNKKNRYEADRKLFDGTEISTQRIRGSFGAAQAAQYKHEQLDDMYKDMQMAWFDANGEWYTPYGAPVGYSYGSQNVTQQEVDIPQELLDMDAEMGINVEVANDLIEPSKKKKA